MDIEVGDWVRLKEKRSVTGFVKDHYPLGAGIAPVVGRWRVSFVPEERPAQNMPVKNYSGSTIGEVTMLLAGGYYTADELEVTAKHTDNGDGEQPEAVASGKGSRKKKATV